jgi:hypothetical protein
MNRGIKDINLIWKIGNLQLGEYEVIGIDLRVFDFDCDTFRINLLLYKPLISVL